MKTVLLITTSFSPDGSGGSFRVAKLAKYLPSYGWVPHILTTTSGLDKWPDDRRFVISRAPMFGFVMATYLKVKGWWGRLRKGKEEKASVADSKVNVNQRRLAEYLLVPDEYVQWVLGALVVGGYVIAKNKPHVIYSSSPAPSALLVGYLLHCFSGIPWILEFRDLWSQNPFRSPRPFGWLERLEQRIERKIVCRASKIIVTSEHYRTDLLTKFPELDGRSIKYAPNGYDPEDFDGVTAKKFCKYTIIHTGNFYGRRTSRDFLEGFDLFLRNVSISKEDCQVLLIGRTNVDTQNDIDRLGLNDVVFQKGEFTPARTIEYMLGADLLLLVPGPGRGTIPGKTYEYMAAGKPILALADEGGAIWKMVTELGLGEAVKCDDVDSIACSILKFYDYKSNNLSHYFLDLTEQRSRYSRKEIARKVALELDEIS
jgi:glycosyltransferase involved in cell wall biosynthesis